MHFIRDKVLQKELDIRFVPSVDLFTKPLSITQFLKLKGKLQVKELKNRIATASTMSSPEAHAVSAIC